MCIANSSWSHLFHLWSRSIFFFSSHRWSNKRRNKLSKREPCLARRVNRKLPVLLPLYFRHVPLPILFNHCVNPPVNQLLSLPITNNKNVRLQVVQGFQHSFTNRRCDIFNDIHAVIGGKLLNKRRRGSVWERDYAFQIVLGAT